MRPLYLCKRSVRKALICCSVSKERYKFTSPPEGEKDISSRLLSDAKSYFPELAGLTTKEQFLSLVGMDPGIKEWYLTWKTDNNTAISSPDWIPSNDVDALAAWREAEPRIVKFSEKQKSWQARINTDAEKLRATVKAVDEEKNQAFNALTPLEVIDMVTENQLLLGDKAQLSTLTGEARRTKAKELVKQYKQQLYTQYKGGAFKNPFQK